MTMNVKDIIVKDLEPTGTSIIDHALRKKLKLSIVEYCVFDVIMKRKKLGKKTEMFDIESYIGLEHNSLIQVTNSLQEKMVVKVVAGEYFINSNIPKFIRDAEKDEYEDEFDKFWTEEKNGKKVNFWPGPKKEAFDKFKLARKSYSFEFIMNQRTNYVALLKTQAWRQKMIATKFLNVKSGQIEEDFLSQIKTLGKPREVTGREKITESQKIDLYK